MSAAPSIPDQRPSGSSSSESDRRQVELIWAGEDQIVAHQMARRHILVCKAGQAVARVVSSAVAGDSVGVSAGALRLGKNVVWDAGKSVYVAQCNGHVKLAHDKLDIEQMLEFAEDVDAGNGPVEFDGDICLHRGILDLVHIRGTRDITVNGCVEAADIHAGRDIVVHHGICGKEKGHVVAGGRVTARFLSNARITAGGDVFIEKESDNSVIHCGGELRADHGTVMSGHVTAAAGIRCHTAGSDSGIKTLLEVGVTPQQQAEIHHLAEAAGLAQRKAAEIRALVQPLLDRQKGLTAAQKEKATELLYSADELENQGRELVAKLEVLKHPLAMAASGAIRVVLLLHPGVIVKFPHAAGVVTGLLRGPLTVRQMNRDGQMVVAAHDDHRGTNVVLHPVDPHSH